MCWKYESEYETCFDYCAYNWMKEEPNVPKALEYFNLEVVDEDALRDALFDMLSLLHENGAIRPCVD